MNPEFPRKLCVLEGVREYGEGQPVELVEEEGGRLAVLATNEAGYNSTAVDLLDLLDWIEKNREIIPALQLLSILTTKEK